MLVATLRSVDGGWIECEYTEDEFNRKGLTQDIEVKDLYSTKEKAWLKKEFVIMAGRCPSEKEGVSK